MDFWRRVARTRAGRASRPRAPLGFGVGLLLLLRVCVFPGMPGEDLGQISAGLGPAWRGKRLRFEREVSELGYRRQTLAGVSPAANRWAARAAAPGPVITQSFPPRGTEYPRRLFVGRGTDARTGHVFQRFIVKPSRRAVGSWCFSLVRSFVSSAK